MIERFDIAGYCRISVDEEQDRDNTSIENQKAIIEDFVKQRFPDSALSDLLGKSSDRRWGLPHGGLFIAPMPPARSRRRDAHAQPAFAGQRAHSFPLDTQTGAAQHQMPRARMSWSEVPPGCP